MRFPVIQNKLAALPLRYGLMGGAISIALFLIFYFMDLNPLVNIKFIDLVILGIFIFFCLKEFRDRYNGGELHFWQGMTAGMMTYMLIALISAVFILIMTGAIDPQLVGDYISTRLDLIELNKQTLIDTIDEKAYSETVAGVKNTTAMDLALDDFLKKVFIGLFLSSIISIVLRK